MPVLDNYLLSNRGIDGPVAFDPKTLKSYEVSAVGTSGAKQYNNLPFKPAFALLQSTFDSSAGTFSYHFKTLMTPLSAGATGTLGRAIASTSDNIYYNASLGVSAVTFGENSLSFTYSGTSFGTIFLTIYGF